MSDYAPLQLYGPDQLTLWNVIDNALVEGRIRFSVAFRLKAILPLKKKP